MAGIYIHIPFCKRICSYCDFFKTTVISLIPDYLVAVEKELEIRRPYLQDEIIETVYIGGGTSIITQTGTNIAFAGKDPAIVSGIRGL